ncbi:hypothetical protein AVEN_79923-1 [Araneus ventricosus]|uniref:Uncharacterized protein n=1 Tax=Araneus ventricosus TaxID=182803 RepID=A0A4Y2GKR5_ARAVE|nr:hypothetical protein AVEN_79923-1 [Araneus ventricosus]
MQTESFILESVRHLLTPRFFSLIKDRTTVVSWQSPSFVTGMGCCRFEISFHGRTIVYKGFEHAQSVLSNFLEFSDFHLSINLLFGPVCPTLNVVPKYPTIILLLHAQSVKFPMSFRWCGI